MAHWRYISILSTWAVFGASCAPSLQTASSRDPALFDKNVTINARPIGAANKPLEIFVKKPQVTIEPIAKQNESGSLFNADDERNYLFASGRPAQVGRYLTVKVSSNRIGDSKSGSSSQSAAAPAAAGEDPELQELLKALPNLEPAEGSSASLVKQLRMKVMHRYENGDALVALSRSSSRADQANEISVQARLPYDRLAAGDGITTNDLMEIRFIEASDGELLERESSGWEDEYTLRLSGFDEAKSKMAVALEDKRKQLMDVKERLENKVEAFGNERRTLAKEREEIGKKQEETQTKISQLSEKIDDQDQTIKEQEEQIRELSPDEKPADEKEGDTGDE